MECDRKLDNVFFFLRPPRFLESNNKTLQKAPEKKRYFLCIFSLLVFPFLGCFRDGVSRVWAFLFSIFASIPLFENKQNRAARRGDNSIAAFLPFLYSIWHLESGDATFLHSAAKERAAAGTFLHLFQSGIHYGRHLLSAFSVSISVFNEAHISAFIFGIFLYSAQEQSGPALAHTIHHSGNLIFFSSLNFQQRSERFPFFHIPLFPFLLFISLFISMGSHGRGEDFPSSARSARSVTPAMLFCFFFFSFFPLFLFLSHCYLLFIYTPSSRLGLRTGTHCIWKGEYRRTLVFIKDNCSNAVWQDSRQDTFLFFLFCHFLFIFLLSSPISLLSPIFLWFLRRHWHFFTLKIPSTRLMSGLAMLPALAFRSLNGLSILFFSPFSSLVHISFAALRGLVNFGPSFSLFSGFGLGFLFYGFRNDLRPFTTNIPLIRALTTKGMGLFIL